MREKCHISLPLRDSMSFSIPGCAESTLLCSQRHTAVRGCLQPTAEHPCKTWQGGRSPAREGKEPKSLTTSETCQIGRRCLQVGVG